MNCRKCEKVIPDDAIFCCYCGVKQELTREKRKRANGMGTITKYKDKWRAKATKYEGTKLLTKTKVCATKKEANEWLANVSWSAVKTEKPVTFQQLYDEWSAIHFPTITHKRQLIVQAAKRCCSKLDHTDWADIGLRLMQECVNSAKETYYPRRDIKNLFSALEKYAVDCGYPSHSFASRLKLPPKSVPHKEAFTDEEIQRLWDYYAQGNDFTGNILIMIYTGMRYGELTTVKKENIHLEEGYLLGGIKSDVGKAGEIILVDKIKPVVKKMLIDGGLKQISDTAFRKDFNNALKKAGCREHTIHECRHTTATILAKNGVQPAIIKEIMRHSSYDMTLEYTHINREDKQKAITDSLDK